MSEVFTGASMSLDGYVAGLNETGGPEITEGIDVTHLRYRVRRA